MKPRTTLLLLALLVAAFAGIKLLGPQPEKDATIHPLIAGLVPETIRQVDLRLRSGEEISLQRRGTVRFDVSIRTRSEPVVDRGNESRIKTLLEAVASAYREDLPAEADAETLRTLGFSDVGSFLRVTTGERSWEIRFGKDDPGGNACFARFAGESTVFRTGRNLKNLLEFNAQNYRYDRIFSFAAMGVDALQIEHPASKEHPEGLLIMLEKGPLGWKLTEPFDARADDSRVMAAVNGLARAQIKSWTSETSDPDAMRLLGMNNPILVTLASGRALETVEFGMRDESIGIVYARKVDHQNIVGVDAAALDALVREPDHFRMRRLLRPVADLLTGIEIRRNDRVRWALRVVAKDRILITQPFECLAEAEGESDSVRAVVRQLESSEAVSFVDAKELAGATELGSIEVRWRERDVPLRVTLKVFDSQSRIFVQRDDEPEIACQVDDSFRDLLDLDPIRIKERRLLPYDKEWGNKVEGAALTVGEEQIVIERRDGGYFEEVSDPRRRTANLQSFFGGLIHRRALRYLSRDESAKLTAEDMGERRAHLTLTLESGGQLEFELFAKTEEGNLLRLDLAADPSRKIVALVDDEFAHDFVDAISP